MRGFYLLLFLALAVNTITLGQSAGDYQSAGSGLWNDPLTWEVHDGVGFIPASVSPTSADGIITVRAFHAVEISATLTIDQVIIESDANLTLTGGTLTINDAADPFDVIVSEGDGFFTNDGFFITNAGTTVINNGAISSSLANFIVNGTFTHQQNGGTIPNGNWADGSLLLIQGIIGTAPGGLSGQSFYDLQWNNGATQTSNIILGNAGATTELSDVRNDFTISGTGTLAGTSNLSLNNTGTFVSLTVGRDFTISGNSTVGIAPGSGLSNPVTVDIGRDFIVNSARTSGVLSIAGATSNVTISVARHFTKSGTGAVAMANTGGAAVTTNASATIDVNGNITWNAGNLTMAAGSNATNNVQGTLNVGGNLTITAGTFAESSVATLSRGNVTFDNAAVHNFTSPVAAPFTGSVNFSIQASNTLNIGSTTSLSGTGSMVLSAGATLGVASPDGLNAGTSLGNIRSTASLRTYTAASNIIYNGSALQVLGNEWGGSGKLVGVSVNLTIANSAGVRNDITPSANLVGAFNLTSGAFDIGSGSTLTIQGATTITGGTITGHDDSGLIFGGSGAVNGSLAFTPSFQTLGTFQIGRNNNINLGSNLTMASTGRLIFGAGATGNLFLNGFVLTIEGQIERGAGGSGALASGNSGSNLVILGAEDVSPLLVSPLTQIPFCTTCGTNVFNNIILNRSGGAVYAWGSAATINGTFSLSSGTLNYSSGITMAANSTFLRGGGTTFNGGNLTASSTYNVEYTGDLTPSGELPDFAAGTLNNLTTAGNIALDRDLLIRGDFIINSGDFNAGTHPIEFRGANLTINSGRIVMNTTTDFTFARSGTPTAVGGAAIGNTTFGDFIINSGTTISAPNANLVVAGEWNNNGTFTANNGTVLFSGAAQDIDAAGQPFWNLIAATGTKTLQSNLDVNGSFTISAGSTIIPTSFTINVAGTWTNNGTFTPGTSTVIFDGTGQAINGNGHPFFNLTAANSGTKTLSSNLDVNGTLTIASGVTLDVTGSNRTINIAGNWTNNGTFNARAGNVIFDGTGGNQTVSGSGVTPFYDITQTNVSSVILSSAQTLSHVLTVSNGTFNTGVNRLTILSTAAADARIAPVAGTITGTMTVQRYLRNVAAAQAYRYIATPVSGAFVSHWKADFPITGTHLDPSTAADYTPGAFPGMVSNSPSLYIYNEGHTPTTTLEDRYESFPPNGSTTAATPLTIGRGYAAFVRFNNPITIDQTGSVAVGQVGVTITNAGNNATNDGWNLIGNPYAAPINWENVTLPGGVDDEIALMDNLNNNNNGTGVFSYYAKGGASVPEDYDGTIAMGQSFWVRKDAGVGATNAVINFQEDDKVATSTPPFIREGLSERLRIHVAGNSKRDELLIHFNSEAQDIADGKFEAHKMKNDFINFSSLTTDGKEMAINAFGSLACSREIPLVLKGVTPGLHTFTFTNLETFQDEVDIRLVDTFTGQTFIVDEDNKVYTFQVTTAPASFGSNRFKAFIGYQDLQLDLVAQAQDICDGSDAEITIPVPQSGVIYRATLNGTSVSDPVSATAGSQLTITIPKANLTEDENQIVLMAKIAGCAELPLEQPVTVKIKGIPTVSSAIGGAVCTEGRVTLSAQGAPTGGSYKWYLTEDAAEPIEGETASSFTTPVLTKTKTYFVAAVNSLGCEGAKKAVTAQITYPYDIVGVTGGQSCNGSSASLKATGAPDDGSYHWYVTQASIEPIPNQTTNTFVTPALTASTTYYVAAVNAAGCEGPRVAVTAELVTLNAAAITVSGDILTSNSDNGNQWYFNGTEIAGATGKTYQPNESGTYKLVVTNGTCKSQAERQHVVTGDITDTVSGYVLYPNPSAGEIFVEVATTKPVAVSIKNQLGSEITGGELKQEGSVRRGRFDISGHASGVYFVVIKQGEQTVIRKLVKN